MTDLNFHAIIGPNGMCLCGVEADGTVVTCGALLEAEIAKRLAAPLPASAALQALISELKQLVKGYQRQIAVERETAAKEAQRGRELLETSADTLQCVVMDLVAALSRADQP